MDAPVTLEPSRAERLLLVAGPCMLPDKDVVSGANTIWKKMVDALEAAIGLEEQKPLKEPSIALSYWDKLQRFDPDYAEVNEALGADGAAFQALQMAAKEALRARKTVSTIDTVRGAREVPVEPDGVDELTWLLQADTVENPMRLIDDFEAGALCYVQVQIFADCFAETYSGLVQVAQMVMAAKPFEWLPPPWLSDMLTTLFQEPLGIGETIAPPERPLKPQRRDRKSMLDALKGPNEAAL